MAIINTTLVLSDVITEVQALLSSFAQSEGFEADIRLAFGDEVLSSAIADLASQLTSGDGGIPPIEVRSPSELQGALGAFAVETNQIFLSSTVLESGNFDLAVAVLLEELSHSFDPVLNAGVDASGDEGEILSALVRGAEFSENQLNVARQDDDAIEVALESGETLLSAEASVSHNAQFSEFQPNPNGTDPSDSTIELSGTPGAAFSGTILSIEGDPTPTSPGIVQQATDVMGTFNDDGLLTVTIPDLENPTFTLVLVSDFTGVVDTTDIDTDDDGNADDLSSLGTIYDAIGVLDSAGDAPFVFGAQLGGIDFAFTGDEPRLIFRESSVGDFFALNDPDGGVVLDSSDNTLPPTFFSDPVAVLGVDTFGAINPTLENASVLVDTLIDEFDGDFTDGDLSLREALSFVADGGTITFASGLATTDAGAGNGVIALNGTELAIARGVTIDGDIDGDGTGDITLDAQGTSRVLNINDGNDANEIAVSLSGLTIIGGSIAGDGGGILENGGGILNRESLAIANSLITGNTADNGGGIRTDSGTINLSNSTLSGNTAAYIGGGVSNSSSSISISNGTISNNSAISFGGGISNSGSTSTSAIANSTISGNLSGFLGGGISNYGGSTSTIADSIISGNTAINGGGVGNSSNSSSNIANSTISGNSALDYGGGISNEGSTSAIANSTISGNTALGGGGIYNESSDSSIINSTIRSNSAADYGGGISHNGGFTTSEIVNSTISGNSAYAGGGVFGGSGSSFLINSTINGNSAYIGGGINVTFSGNTTLVNSLIAGNIAPTNGNEIFLDNGTIDANANNLFGDSSQLDLDAFGGTFAPGVDDLNATGDDLNVDLANILDPAGLQDNGGSTETIALVSGSPALNGGDSDAAINLVESDFGVDFNNDGDTDDTLTQVNELAFDQRGIGFDRIISTSIDIGAFANQIEISVVLDDDGNLIITDFIGTLDNDPLTLTLDGDDLVISAPNNLLEGAGTSVIQTDANTVTVPVANITGVNGITVNTLGGSDQVLLDLADISVAGIQVNGGDDNDTLSGSLTTTSSLELFGEAGDDSLTGGAGNDTLLGGDNDDYLFGSQGEDRLIGEDGNDSLLGGTENDSLFGGTGNDTLEGNSGDDVLNGGADGDELQGNSGNDSLFGQDGSDLLLGDEGEDRLAGGAGDDTIRGGSGNDFLIGGDNDDNLLGGQGDDTLRGEVGNDFLNGGAGLDRLQGDEGNDTLLGGGDNTLLLGNSGDDRLLGSGGIDTLIGGEGNDFLSGGEDGDIFVIQGEFTAIGLDRIVDFTVDDTLRLSRGTFGLTGSSIGQQFESVVNLSNAEVSSALIVYNASNGRLFFNANGAEAGFGTGGQFATLSNQFDLQDTDITLAT